MGIVVITIPGEAKRSFTNSLQNLTGGKVELVIIQKQTPNHNSFLNRFKRLYRLVGLKNLPQELFYALLIRIDREARMVLEYFRERNGSLPSNHIEYTDTPKVLEVYSVNSQEVLDVLKKISPKLLVIWAGTIIKPHIINTAQMAINLHMGLCPHYRGAVANQHAVMKGDVHKIGATIHYAHEKVDTGDILETIIADTSKRPKELFRDLNNRAEKRYLEIANRLFMGEKLDSRPQNSNEGENFLLKNWTPKTRYKLATQIRKWEKTGSI